MHRTLRSRIIFVALLTLLALPLTAGARGMETSRPATRTAEGWAAAAWDWFQELAGRRPHREKGPTASLSVKSEQSQAGGSCIDPQGRPRPWIECL